MTGPFGWEEFGEYFSEEPSASEIQVNPFGPTSQVFPLIVQDSDVQVPFIASTTQVFTLVVDDNPGRLSSEPVETITSPTSQYGRLSSIPAEVLLAVNPNARLSSEPVEVGINGYNPNARLSSLPVEICRPNPYDMAQVIWVDLIPGDAPGPGP